MGVVSMKRKWRHLFGSSLLACWGTLSAAPSSNVAYTQETMDFIGSGEPAAGQEKAANCVACHGAEGVSSNPTYPSIAGQLASYTYKQLKDYKDGKRMSPQMAAFVSMLGDQDMADVAAWYASLPPPPPKPSERELSAAQALVQRGDGQRLIPACAACHGDKGEGKQVGNPALAGQNALHFKQTMQAYKMGRRANDVYSVMRVIAKELTEEEIDLLAEYYAALE